MPVPLRFDLIRAIVRHGAQTTGEEPCDPSLNEYLRTAGLGAVTVYIQHLSLLDIVRDPFPLFGADGGMWIGYRLSDRGRELAKSDEELRRVVAPLIGGPANEVSEAVALLQAECSNTELNEVYREDFLQTLDEIRICFDQECFIAVIALSGKILEVCLKELLMRHGVQPDPKAMIGSLIRTIRERLPHEYLDPSLLDIVNIVNASRIPAIHAKERIPVPSRDQAVMVVFATRDVVKRVLIRSANA